MESTFLLDISSGFFFVFLSHGGSHGISHRFLKALELQQKLWEAVKAVGNPMVSGTKLPGDGKK